MYKIVIAGGPHTGKSTLFEALRNQYQDHAHFTPEAAEIIIKRELAKKAINPKYEPILPLSNYPLFAWLSLEEQQRRDMLLAAHTKLKLNFQDRCYADDIAYGYVHGYTEHIPRARQLLEDAKYKMAFFCEPVGKYAQTAIRHEDPILAQKIHETLNDVYDSLDIPVVHLPNVPVGARLGIITTHLWRLGHGVRS